MDGVNAPIKQVEVFKTEGVTAFTNTYGSVVVINPWEKLRKGEYIVQEVPWRQKCPIRSSEMECTRAKLQAQLTRKLPSDKKRPVRSLEMDVRPSKVPGDGYEPV